MPLYKVMFPLHHFEVRKLSLQVPAAQRLGAEVHETRRRNLRQTLLWGRVVQELRPTRKIEAFMLKTGRKTSRASFYLAIASMVLKYSVLSYLYLSIKIVLEANKLERS